MNNIHPGGQVEFTDNFSATPPISKKFYYFYIIFMLQFPNNYVTIIS